MEARTAAPGRTAAAGAGASPRPPKIAAQGADKVSWAENPPPREQQPPAPPPQRLFSAEAIKKLFGKIAKAVINELAPKPRRRRKRDDDTRGLFKRLAMKLLRPAPEVIFSLGDFNCFTPPAELDETQRRLFRERTSQADFWHSQQHQPFDYARSTHLSPRL